MAKQIMKLTTQQDKDIQELDALARCDYYQAVDLGASHQKAIMLATSSKLFEAFLNMVYK